MIAADGIRSATREIIFGEEAKIKFLGLYNAWFTIPRIKTDNNWARWYNAPGSRVLMIRPDNHGTMRASLSFLSDKQSYVSLPHRQQKDVIKAKLEGAGWEAARLIKEIDKNEDVYFDGLSQVHAPRWFNGRAGMIGDAAYCPTPLTGMGASMAMVGGYLLAWELANNKNYHEAFNCYEKRMRPYVEDI